MSIKIMTWVWDHSASQGNHRLVLLAMADNANDAGFCWPSLATIANKARVSIATVRRSVRALVELGELRQEGTGGGHKSSTYRILWTQDTPTEAPTSPTPRPAVEVEDATPGPTSRPEISGVADCYPSQIATPTRGGNLIPQGLHPCYPRGITAVLPEPSLTIIEPSGGARSRTTAAKGTRIPEAFAFDDGMRRWADENFPWLNLDEATNEFRDYWRAVPGARGVKLDWSATWRNSIRKTAERVPDWRRKQLIAERRPTPRPVPGVYPGDPDDVEAYVAWINSYADGGAR